MHDADDIKASLAEAYDAIEPVFAEMYGQSDRAAAITASAFFEEKLVAALVSRFVPLSNTIRDELFEGPVASLRGLSAKIDIGYAVGLYGKVTRTDLHKARTIRNDFAHHYSIRAFSHPKVLEKCNALMMLKAMPRNALRPAETLDARGLYLNTLTIAGQLLKTRLPKDEAPILP